MYYSYLDNNAREINEMKKINKEDLRQHLINTKTLKEITCSRCSGSGMTDHLHINAGVCFKCDGGGRVSNKWLSIYFRLVKINARSFKRAEEKKEIESRVYRNERSKNRTFKRFNEKWNDEREHENGFAYEIALSSGFINE